MDTFKLSNCDEKVEFRRSGELIVTVKDSGAGLETDQVQNLFRPFVQFNVNELQAGMGSGLVRTMPSVITALHLPLISDECLMFLQGLYIAKGICEQHGGTLVAASEGLDKGTIFTVTLPLHHVRDESLPTGLQCLQLGKGRLANAEGLEEVEGLYPPALVRVQPLRILVVDDALLNRQMLVRLLESKGHFCEQAEDGKVAVEQVKKALGDGYSYDTILLDFEMPGKLIYVQNTHAIVTHHFSWAKSISGLYLSPVMNGPSAAMRIRNAGCDTFIVGVTGNVLPDDVTYFNECGAN